VTRGGSHRWLSSAPARRIFLAALVVLVSAAVVATGMRAPGSEFDEGILVTFPTRVAAGDLPYRDFETFYGPASPYLVAAAFELAGPHLATERFVGLLLRVVLVLVVFLLVRRFGNVVALCCAGIALVLVGGSTEADGGFGSDAFLLLAVLLATTGGANPGRRRWWVAAGLAAGVAGLFRPEAALVALVAVGALLWPDARRAGAFMLGLGVGLLPYVPLAAATGYQRLRENVDDLRATGTARRLPLPALTTGAGRVLVLVIVALALLASAYAVSHRRRRPHATLLLSLLLVGVLQFPYGLWRADEGHLIGAGLVPVSLAPLSVAMLLMPWQRAAAVGASLVILVSLALPSELRGDYSRNLRVTAGLRDVSSVSNDGRSFVVDDAAAAVDLQATIDFLKQHAPAGSRLFVGPRDLRRTDANDAMLYYLLPDLVPATFYLEMDPPFSRASSRLAGDVGAADYLVLTTRWDRQQEPNDSSRYGSGKANRVVSSRFCRRAAFGTYTVWQRCAGGATTAG
jgi:hypothetical protein